jgi:hypothetical protein
MLVLVGCEESQVVTRAFRVRGHAAFSCDLTPTRGNPDWHLVANVEDAISLSPWDLIILHPPCTAMAMSGNGTYGPGKPRYAERVKALAWTQWLWELAKAHATRVCLENPVSAIFNLIHSVQYVEPWWFGHAETKRTGLALFNLPKLVPTEVVNPVWSRIHGMSPSATRSRDRAETSTGLAAAMADQWGGLDGY